MLDRAEDVLAGSLDISGHSLRIACWLARSALEESVGDLLASVGLDPGTATMRSRLACLEVRFGRSEPHLVADVAYAWTELSRAAHHHAFRLSPTLTEVRHLVELVRGIQQRCPTVAATA